MRHTKIVCTIGPATRSEAHLRNLVQAGMDVARLNFSHGSHDEHLATLQNVRHAAESSERAVAVLQDLGGPKIRLGELPEAGVELRAGDSVDLVSVSADVGDGALPVRYDHLVDDVAPGEPILLADGLVELEVTDRSADRLTCRVSVGGRLTSHKGVNLPASDLRVPAFTDKDQKDLEFGLRHGVDLVALSFVRRAQDLGPVRDRLSKLENPPLLVAKIEKPQAVDDLEAIVEAVDGVMVARGDLGVEMPPERVPLVQKRIISTARRAARPVITATQMLRSMVANPRPLRAEASDVANAILDGTGALMLSEETAIGAHPIEAVRVMDRIARAVEPEIDRSALLAEPLSPTLPLGEAALSRAVAALSRDLGAVAIVAATTSGTTPRMISRMRPATPVVGLTPSPEVARQLALSWGVIPAISEPLASTDELFRAARRCCLAHGFASTGDRIVVTAGLPMATPGLTNLLHVLNV